LTGFIEGDSLLFFGWLIVLTFVRSPYFSHVGGSLNLFPLRTGGVDKESHPDHALARKSTCSTLSSTSRLTNQKVRMQSHVPGTIQSIKKVLLFTRVHSDGIWTAREQRSFDRRPVPSAVCKALRPAVDARHFLFQASSSFQRYAVVQRATRTLISHWACARGIETRRGHPAAAFQAGK
jgi:hypothetical protein